MGIPFSFLGLPGVGTFATGQVYDKYFKDIKNYDEFHKSFIDFCSQINQALPGKHYTVPTRKELEEFYNTKWQGSEETKKAVLIDYLKEHIREYKTDEKSMILAGVVAPPAATALKKAGENTPQLKKFRLHLIPNFVFVPTCTLLALVGVRAFRIKSSTKA